MVFLYILGIVFFLPLYVGEFSADKLFFFSLVFLFLGLKRKKFPFHPIYMILILIFTFYLSFWGVGYEPFEVLILPLFLFLILFFSPINLADFGKYTFIFLSFINILQLIFLGWEKKKLAFPSGNPTYTALGLWVAFLLWEDKIKAKRKKFWLELFLVFQLLFLQSRATLVGYFIYKLFSYKEWSFKKLIIFILIGNVLLLVVSGYCPQLLLKYLPWNYRLYIWSLFNYYRNLFPLSGPNIFKLSSYEAQQNLVSKNFNLVYDVNHIETLHNDYLQVIFDYHLWGGILCLYLFWNLLRMEDRKIRLFFPFLWVATFHNIIYSFFPLFLLLPLLKSALIRSPVYKEFKGIFFSLAKVIIVFCFFIILFRTSLAVMMDNLYIYTFNEKYLKISEYFYPNYYLTHFLYVQKEGLKQEKLAVITSRKDPVIFRWIADQFIEKYNCTGKIFYLLKGEFFMREALKMEPLNFNFRKKLCELYYILGKKKEYEREKFLLFNLKYPSKK